tara:strand:- start:545 stop:730 length:186 start_codon:yes stop_codon:yes gene_type:complete
LLEAVAAVLLIVQLEQTVVVAVVLEDLSMSLVIHFLQVIIQLQLAVVELVLLFHLLLVDLI